jgi:hypothetical protein
MLYHTSKDKYILRVPFTTCWEWIGQRWKSGYGYLRPNRKIVSAHRYIYEELVGPIPDGLDLLHSCDNPGCVNPDHLRPGTHSENMKEAYRKGRKSQRGEKNGNYRHGNRMKKSG